MDWPASAWFVETKFEHSMSSMLHRRTEVHLTDLAFLEVERFQQPPGTMDKWSSQKLIGCKRLPQQISHANNFDSAFSEILDCVNEC
jgi:hypothetical protein